MREKTSSQIVFERYIEQGLFKHFESIGLEFFQKEIDGVKERLKTLGYEEFGYEITEISLLVEKKIATIIREHVFDNIRKSTRNYTNWEIGIEQVLYSHIYSLGESDLDFPELSRIIMSDVEDLYHSEEYYKYFKLELNHEKNQSDSL